MFEWIFFMLFFYVCWSQVILNTYFCQRCQSFMSIFCPRQFCHNGPSHCQALQLGLGYRSIHRINKSVTWQQQLKTANWWKPKLWDTVFSCLIICWVCVKGRIMKNILYIHKSEVYLLETFIFTIVPFVCFLSLSLSVYTYAYLGIFLRLYLEPKWPLVV